MQLFFLHRFRMLKIYLYKCLLILYVSSFSINCCGSQEESLEKTVSSKRPHTELEQAIQDDTQPRIVSSKKQKAEEIETPKNREEEEEREATEEEVESKPSNPIPSEGSITKAADIGTWVGDKENGIENFQLSYQGTLISEEFKKWHLQMGTQINKIINHLGPEDDATNYIRARIDIIYKNEDSPYECQGASIPVLFLSGFSDANAQTKVLKLQEDISHITADPCISISSYFKGESLWKENYVPIREELSPFFLKASAPDRLSEKFLQREEASIMHSNKHAFQFWLHSEEPVLLYIMGHPALKADGKGLSPTFREIIQGIKLPKDAIPELCILSMVSRNDCCTHCRPLLFEAMEHKDFLEKSISEGLELKTEINLVKILLYSSLHEFQFKRPSGGYQEKLNITSPDNVLFLMAGNVPSKEE